MCCRAGKIALTPLFDFAAMYLHPEGIARATRWQENDNGHPDWHSAVAQAARASDLPVDTLAAGLKELIAPLHTLIAKMHEHNLPDHIVERTERLTVNVMASLQGL